MSKNLEDPDDDRDAHRPGGLAPGSRRKLLTGALSSPVIVTLMNRPAFAWQSACNYSGHASIEASGTVRYTGGDDPDVWYRRANWDVGGYQMNSDFAAACGIKAYLATKKDGQYIFNVQSLDFKTALGCAYNDGGLTATISKKTYNLGYYIAQGCAAFLNELYYKTHFGLSGCGPMIQSDFANYFCTGHAGEDCPNYRRYRDANNDCDSEHEDG